VNTAATEEETLMGSPPIPPTDRTTSWMADSDRSMVTVAVYDDYASAQRAVDHLSDNRFPVERSAIVGTGLRLVEKVTGRLTVGKAALAGAVSGAWIGLFIGLLFGIFSVSDWWRVILFAVVLGALWGAAFGAIAHAFTGGRRDFSSLSRLEAARYAVVVDAEFAEPATRLLTGLTKP